MSSDNHRPPLVFHTWMNRYSMVTRLIKTVILFPDLSFLFEKGKMLSVLIFFGSYELMSVSFYLDW